MSSDVIKGYGKTDVGKVRQNNEDSIFVSNDKIGHLNNLFIVADGMGGHNAGEVASGRSIEFFIDFAKKTKQENGLIEYLKKGVAFSNRNVFNLSVENPAQSGMGTTFTVLSEKDGTIYFAHVGDSRFYIIAENQIRQITEDHTLVNEMLKSGEINMEEAKTHPKRNLITRALGTENDLEIDGGSLPLNDKEIGLICSDGLINMLSDNEILEIVNSSKIEDAPSRLIQEANNRGGFDNISVILIHKG